MSAAQTAPAVQGLDSRGQAWAVATLTAPLSDRLRLFGEVQPHVGMDQTTFELHGLLGYQLTPSVSLWSGYAWTPQFSPKPVDEHRFYEQLSVQHLIGTAQFNHRTRIEERWISTASGTALRFRQLAKVSVPLGAPGGFSAIASEELFVNLNSLEKGPQAGLDQNRAFAGLGHLLTDSVAVEAGYLNNYVFRPIGTDRMNHVLLIQLSARLPEGKGELAHATLPGSETDSTPRTAIVH